LDYYKTIENRIFIYYNVKNDGHMVFWKKSEFNKRFKGYYVITDPDVVPIDECPKDFMRYFLKILKKYDNVHKVGFSLKTNDIPDGNKQKEYILKWESKFWSIKTADGDFMADIDTTFALYRPLNEKRFFNFYSAIRSNFPIQAKHMGWYVDHSNLNEELKNYYTSSNDSSSWKTDESGALINRMYD
jgi:hypothetical protein